MTGQSNIPPPPPPPPAGPPYPASTVGPTATRAVKPDWREGPRASTRALRAVVVSAVAAAVFWGNGAGSLGTGLWLVILGVLVVAAPSRRDRLRLVAVAASMVFAAYLALRASPWLVPLNLLAGFGLVAFAAVLPADRSILQRPAMVMARYVGLFRLIDAVAYVVRPLEQAIARRDRNKLRSVAAGLAIAAPIVVILGSLLAAGDAVFSAAFDQFTFADQTGVRVMYALAGAIVATTLMLATSRSWTTPGEPARVLGTVEATIVAGAVAVLYAAFAVAQAVATFGGVDQVLETAGLTRAEYARDGFFQLLWAAGLTLGTLLVLDRLRRRERGGTFRVFATVTSMLTILVVAVSIDRLLTYVDDFGWTMLRLYTVLFAAWIGLLFLGLASRFAGLRLLQDWYPVFVAVTGLIWLLALNVANPEAFVARENLATADHADAVYLRQLSPDATPAILDGLDTLSDADQQMLLESLCGDADASMLGNIGRARAFDAVASRC
ncbi:MAG: DUF4173 domain-containing protein [Actinomycetota bacterium]